MRHLSLVVLLICAFHLAVAQNLEQLQAALGDPQKKIQAIHTYPPDVQDGECHHVEIVSIQVSGSEIKIVEKWINWTGGKATTTLTGKLDKDMASGNWVSSFSSGSWSYNFSKATGQWDKPKGMGTFSSQQKLRFLIIPAGSIKDGFFKCP